MPPRPVAGALVGIVLDWDDTDEDEDDDCCARTIRDASTVPARINMPSKMVKYAFIVYLHLPPIAITDNPTQL